MLKAPIPHDEGTRLHRLQTLDLLDGGAEASIDAFTRLAADMTGMPICLVSLVDAERQWIKSAAGPIAQGCQTPRDVSFCGHTILGDDLFEVEDARLDERFADNPFVTGEPRVIHYAGAPLVMPGGERIGSLCVVDHKPGQLTAQQRTLLTGLAKMLVDVLLMREKDRAQTRRADAAARAAEQARTQADAANRAKSEFLATMSHEIRTPINGVIGLAQLLTKQKLPPQAEGYVGSLASCAGTLLNLVDGILDLSKIEAGQIIIEPQDTDVHALLREVSDLFKARAAEKQLAFECQVLASVPRWVRVDSHRLRQMLLNLLGNAYKFTDRGAFSLNVAAIGHELVFDIHDSGIGIASRDQSKLFTRFTQADASTSRRFGGSGLGLAISRELAQLMGGSMSLASELGIGSTFTLRLPLVRGERQAVAAEAPDQARSALQASILVVDDNDINLMVAAGVLEGFGFTDVTCVESGAQALAAFDSNSYDIVLMDCQMPDMDGYEATRRLRQRGYGGPVIALTAGARSTDKEACFKAGMTGFLTKPYAPEDLLRTLESAAAVLA